MLAFVLTTFFGADVSIYALPRPLAMLLAATILLQTLLTLLLGRYRGAAATAVLIILLRSDDLLHLVALVVLFGAIAAAGAWWRRISAQSMTWERATGTANVVVVLLILVLLANAVIVGRAAAVLRDIPEGRPLQAAVDHSSGAIIPDSPDIYVIMLEDYPRADTLQRLFHFDNSVFLKGLEARGMAVATHSHSNYMYTPLNLSSMLQMRLLQDLPEFRDNVATGATTSLRELINHNPAYTFLRNRGYLTLANLTPWEEVAQRSADLLCGDDIATEFEELLLRSTLLYSITGETIFAGRDRAAITTALACLARAVTLQLRQPRFVFTHVPGPHLPIVFTADGEPAPGEVFGATARVRSRVQRIEDVEMKVDASTFLAAYVEQVEYLNKRALEAIDEILQNSNRPPVIILMSDEGSESHLNWSDWRDSDLAERYSSLFAALTPGYPRLFGDAPTPANVFPSLFNAYFDQDLPVISDRFFVSNEGSEEQLHEVPPPAGVR